MRKIYEQGNGFAGPEHSSSHQTEAGPTVDEVD